jgi:hypothetical protein
MFTIVSTVILFALTLMWRNDSGINLFIKVALAAMSVWGIVLIAQGAF